MKKLEMCDNDHSLGWVDFRTRIAGNIDFTLTYDIEKDKWWCQITNGFTEPICSDFEVDDETAFNLLSEEDHLDMKNMKYNEGKK
jgi:hypothetical protein